MKELLLELSYKCNFNCIHCSSINCDATLSLNTVKKIKNIDAFTMVRISGGEPLLYSELIDILKYLKSKKAYIILQTNGSQNIPTDILYNINEIWTSLYGGSEIHNFVTRNSKSFSLLTTFVHNYQNIKEIIFQTPIFSLEQSISAVSIAKKYNLPIRFTALVNQGRCNFAFTHEKQAEIILRIKKMYDKIIVPCSLSLTSCDYDSKMVIKPDGNMFNCASHKHGKVLCKR